MKAENGKYNISFLRYEPQGIGISISSYGDFIGRVYLEAEDVGRLLRMEHEDISVKIKNDQLGSHCSMEFMSERNPMNRNELAVFIFCSQHSLVLNQDEAAVLFEALKRSCIYYFEDYTHS